jgi:hypothetical protein
MSITRSSPVTARRFTFNDPKPWPTSVEGDKLLNTLAAAFKQYLVLPPGAGETLALFVVHTYAFDVCEISPLLVVTSPVPQCGKTRTLDIIDALAFRTLRASNATPAVVFRTIEAYHPTLLLDEYDTYLSGREDFRGILNSGHTKHGAFVLRCDTSNDGDYAPQPFSTWCPKVLAGIKKLAPTLQDRAIVIPMKRKGAKEKVDRLRLSGFHNRMQGLRQQLTRWVADTHKHLKEADPKPVEGFADRANDNWSPLLAIADAAGGEWPQRARRAARALAALSDDSAQDVGIQLLADVRAIFAEHGDPARLPSDALACELTVLEGRPWPEFGRFCNGISVNQLAKLLGEFSIKPDKYRNGTRTTRGYARKDFEEAWAAYLDGNSTVATGTGGTEMPRFS